jgi:hypothetical protein
MLRAMRRGRGGLHMSAFTSSGGFRPWAHRGAAALFFLFGTACYEATADQNDLYVNSLTPTKKHDRHDGSGFTFTGPPEFYSNGAMTCHRAKAVMRFRLGYTDLVVHNCHGRLYRIEGRRGNRRDLVTLDAFTTNPVGVRRLR